ncbi:hypothetical protein F4802DRAFT_336833 [Xylaria palmicola]|nr:hypothetical protein F4802DRAFT_336833 [Xylaria palmicola]
MSCNPGRETGRTLCYAWPSRQNLCEDNIAMNGFGSHGYSAPEPSSETSGENCSWLPVFRYVALRSSNRRRYTVSLILETLLALDVLKLNYSAADIIEKTRLDTIKALLTPFQSLIQRLIKSDRSLCN